MFSRDDITCPAFQDFKFCLFSQHGGDAGEEGHFRDARDSQRGHPRAEGWRPHQQRGHHEGERRPRKERQHQEAVRDPQATK